MFGCKVFKLDLLVALQIYPVLWWYTGDRMLPAPLEVNDKTEYIVDSILWHCSRSGHY